MQVLKLGLELEGLGLCQGRLRFSLQPLRFLAGRWHNLRALRYFQCLTSGYYGIPVVSSSLCAYSVNSVSSVVEMSLATGYNQWFTDYNHRGTERTEDSQRTRLFYYPL